MKLYLCNILFIASVLLCSACSDKSKDARYNVLNSELKESHQLTVDKTIKQVLFMNDVGCPNCVTSFSNYVLNNIDKYKDSTLIIINSKGLNVDLNRFTSLGMKNVVISNETYDQKTVIPSLGVVYLSKDDNRVDTIISVDAASFADKLNYIDSRR